MCDLFSYRFLPEGESLLFLNKQFVILGFDATSEQEMSLLIRHYKGTVLPVTTRKVPDYAVVPVFGCPVTLTAADIVTNAWVVSVLLYTFPWIFVEKLPIPVFIGLHRLVYIYISYIHNTIIQLHYS